MEHVGTVADRLFRGFLAPLVLGGEMHAGKPIGARAALALAEGELEIDRELASHVALGRVRVARALAPIDRVSDATGAEWMLGAALHDLVQATHPGFDGAFRRASASRLTALVDATLDRAPRIVDLRDALSRHTWFSRVFEITRTDTKVSWWTGSTTFLGTDPPPRLMAWPELRRVNVDRTPRKLVELPSHGAALSAPAFLLSLGRFLAATPLTDLATCARGEPAFAWTAETLGLIATAGGRTLAERALAHADPSAVDSALGRATKALFANDRLPALASALPLLANRAIAVAQSSSGSIGVARGDAAIARAIGALAARAQIAAGALPLTAADAHHTAELLHPIAASAPHDVVEAVTAALAI